MMATKKQNKRTEVRRARRVLANPEVDFTRVGNNLHRRHYGSGLRRSDVRTVDQVDDAPADAPARPKRRHKRTKEEKAALRKASWERFYQKLAAWGQRKVMDLQKIKEGQAFLKKHPKRA
jgi:hypothetical protein